MQDLPSAIPFFYLPDSDTPSASHPISFFQIQQFEFRSDLLQLSVAASPQAAALLPTTASAVPPAAVPLVEAPSKSSQCNFVHTPSQPSIGPVLVPSRAAASTHATAVPTFTPAQASQCDFVFTPPQPAIGDRTVPASGNVSVLYGEAPFFCSAANLRSHKPADQEDFHGCWP